MAFLPPDELRGGDPLRTMKIGVACRAVETAVRKTKLVVTPLC